MMMKHLPWCELKQVAQYNAVNVVAVVVQQRGPKQSKRNDSTLWLGLVDSSQEQGELFSVNLFQKDFNGIPQSVEGCVAVLNKIKIGQFDGKILGTGYQECGIAFYSVTDDNIDNVSCIYSNGRSIVPPSFASVASDLLKSNLKSSFLQQTFTAPQQPITATSTNKYKRISEISPDFSSVFDLIVELVGVSDGNNPENLCVEVTDYTKNSILSEIPGSPLSQMILKIYVWGEQRSHFKAVKGGAYLKFQNLKLRSGAKFQVNLYEDSDKKVFVLNDSDAEVKLVLERRSLYLVHKEEKSPVSGSEQIQVSKESLVNLGFIVQYTHQVPSKFCCEAIIVDYYPKEFPRDYGKQLSVLLMIADEYAQIPVLVTGEDLKIIEQGKIPRNDTEYIGLVERLNQMKKTRIILSLFSYYINKETKEIMFRLLSKHQLKQNQQ